MISIFYVGKRTLIDILRGGVFWGALILVFIISALMLYFMWRSMEDEAKWREGPRDRGHGHIEYSDPDMSGDPFANIDEKSVIQYFVFSMNIIVVNLFSIFISMGLIRREIDRKTVEIFLARPVTRGQLYIGKFLGGWLSCALFLALSSVWCIAWMYAIGMGFQERYMEANAIAILSPGLVSAITIMLSIWIRGTLAGLLCTISTFGSGMGSLMIIKFIGTELIKQKWVTWAVYKILPPLYIVGQHATDHLHKDLYMNGIRTMINEQGLMPGSSDGLYSEPWHLAVYFGAVLILGYISFFRKQFS